MLGAKSRTKLFAEADTQRRNRAPVRCRYNKPDPGVYAASDAPTRVPSFADGDTKKNKSQGRPKTR